MMTIVAVIALIGIIVGVIAYLKRGSNSAEVSGSEGLDVSATARRSQPLPAVTVTTHTRAVPSVNNFYSASYGLREGEERVFYLALAGYSAKNGDGVERQKLIRQCKPGQPIELRVFPNEVPSKQIAVFTKYGRIGFIEAYHAPRLARELTVEGKRFNVEIYDFDDMESVRLGRTDVFSRKGNRLVKLRFAVLKHSSVASARDDCSS